VITLKDVQGRVAYLATILRDISDRKQAEHQRLELALLEERLAAFKEFLGMISHDLKTPMSVILTSAELLERIEDPERRHQKLVGIRQQINLLQTYVQDLLLLTRMEHLPAITLEPLDVNKLLREVQTHVALAAEEKGITLSVETGALPSTILADEEAIYHTMTNLIENAVHYTLAGGSVTVATRRDDPDTIIEVSDTGIGIDPADIEHIFDRFYRTKEARRLRPSGTGLGLAIVKRIVEAHAGKMEVESKPGVGTTFRIRLPQTQA
jgi:two-component system OmpR family sensor kinase